MRPALSTAVACSLALTSIAIAPATHAIDKIYSPNIVKGEFEAEYSGVGTFHNDGGGDNYGHEFELEYGLTNRFLIELSSELEKESGSGTKFEAVEIGGRYQFTETGEYWVDSGAQLAYIHALHDGDADALEGKLLLEKESGKFLHRANLGLEQEIGRYAEGGPDVSLGWNSRYRYSPYFEPGFEWQSDFGKTSDNLGFQKQEHYVGPAAYGKIGYGFKYEAAYYFGVTDASADTAARVLLEYETVF